MKKFLLSLLIFFSCIISAHTVNYGKVILRHWNISAEKKYVDGTFYMYKGGDVYIEDAQNQVIHYPLASLSADDQSYVHQRYDRIVELNNELRAMSRTAPAAKKTSIFDLKLWVSLVILISLGIFTYSRAGSQQLKYLMPVLLVGVITFLFGFSNHVVKSLRATTTDPLYIDSAFNPYKPGVITSWDTQYFYVGSYGMPSPSQQMMVGITNWNQQVPLPQCYTGTNVWSIPLNPVIAASPIPVNDQNFLRGAIALAANGIPIFNVYTNTGTDAYLSGQLDSFGGHSGRADDYHYHIAPLFLQNTTAPILPVAFAFDGFAVYGTLEPDGAAMLPLDTNHGHYGASGVYHYHGTPAAPYMIHNFVGQVTQDTTLQLVPQAASHPVRAGQDPLPGATIIGCRPNCVNGYTLSYLFNGQVDSIVYSWTSAGVYKYTFYSNGTDTATQTYNGFIPCYTLPLCTTTSITDVTAPGTSFVIYPNPSNDEFYLKFEDGTSLNEISSVTVSSLTGEVIYQAKGYKGNIDLRNAAPGMYVVKVGFADHEDDRKLIVSSVK
jgi:hypothetical protein